MRRHIFYCSKILILIMMFSQSCRYKDGPDLSLRSASARLEGQYHVEKFLIDGVDFTQDYADSCHCNFVFLFGDGEFDNILQLNNCRSISQNNLFFYERYYLLDHAKEIQFTFSSGGNWSDSIFGYGPFDYGITSEWNIERLTNTEMIFETIYQNKHYRVEFKEFEY